MGGFEAHRPVWTGHSDYYSRSETQRDWRGVVGNRLSMIGVNGRKTMLKSKYLKLTLSLLSVVSLVFWVSRWVGIKGVHVIRVSFKSSTNKDSIQ